MQRHELMVNIRGGCINSNVNNSILAKYSYRYIMATSLPQCPKSGSNTLLRYVHLCTRKKTHTDNHKALMQPETDTCPVTSRISRVSFPTAHCASPHEAVQNNSLAITSDVSGNFTKQSDFLGSGWRNSDTHRKCQVGYTENKFW